MDRENSVKSVARALDIIEIVSRKESGFGVTEIANKMDMNKSSVHRTLSTLLQFGYVHQDTETGKYRLGYKFLDLGSRLLDSLDLRTEAKPYLLELGKSTNEVIHLVVHEQGEVVYIEKLEGNETLRMHSKVGRHAPMHCTSVGKAIMAFLSEKETQSILKEKGMKRHTESTIIDEVQLLNELKKIRQDGCALDMEENEPGIVCIAVPVFDYFGKAIGAVSVSGPAMRMTTEKLQLLKEKMKIIGSKISFALGYREEE
ncbi:IclR family transcriptional regulator [Bacillus massilinigeriensis]|uniref:IclR family transcriptional regulator n=1 Tax=Bacillus mediterraneensis TaxID=1805474 RepID=UPI0008F86AE0|nr:IclR family transcriptional regulator [Bacillus mediterraneensis]